MKDKLLQIINHYGLDKQLKYIHSEYFELDEAIWNYQNSGWDFDYEDAEQLEREYKHHIAEELADIQVMLKQFQYYFDIEDEENSPKLIKKFLEVEQIMIKKLRDILNTYTDEELEELELWINSNDGVGKIIVDDHSIDLIEESLMIDIKEG